MNSSIVGVLKAIPGITEFVARLAGTADEAKRQAQLVEFQQSIIGFQALIASVQQENLTLLGQIRDLEDKLKKAEAWSTEKERYKLAQPYSGTIVYALQRSMSLSEPPHYLCAHCYQDGKKSILQVGRAAGDKDGLSHLICPSCKSTSRTGYRGGLGLRYSEDITAPK